VTFLGEARQDLVRLAADDPDLARRALLLIRDLELGKVTGEPLAAMAKAGDLGDCRKLYFGSGDAPSHRAVYRERGRTREIEIIEVIAVESRSEMYAYLLASVRLGRLPPETAPEFNRVHQQVIARRAAKRKP
jgi:hypothetical protein